MHFIVLVAALLIVKAEPAIQRYCLQEMRVSIFIDLDDFRYTDPDFDRFDPTQRFYVTGVIRQEYTINRREILFNSTTVSLRALSIVNF